VPLGTKEIAPSLVAASYADRDSGKADGIVDLAFITFDKKVKKDGLSLLFDWGSNIPPVIVQSSAISYGSDSMTVSINLGGLFSAKPLIKTSGDMFVTSQWKTFPGQTDNIKLKDSAGPVITAASYLLSGEVGGDCDTLVVFFSEPTSINPNQNATPFKFLNKGNGSVYSLSVSQLIPESNDTAARFCVNSNLSIALPKTGDSIWINPMGGVSDSFGVVQGNERNRKAAFKVSQPNSELTMKVLRNPFVPGAAIPGTGLIGTAITISTINPKAKLQSLTGSIKIFDLLGNFIYEGNAVKQDLGAPLNTLYCFQWEGRNQVNRYVGAGVYQMKIKYTVEGELPKEKWIRIGVTR